VGVGCFSGAVAWVRPLRALVGRSFVPVPNVVTLSPLLAVFCCQQAKGVLMERQQVLTQAKSKVCVRRGS
jgi:hypothetical protein